jgi:uroporphyrin-III C-methyltransferase
MDERDYQGWHGLTRAATPWCSTWGWSGARIREGMLRAGPRALPVALVVAGCSPRQQVHEATLDGLAQLARALLARARC